MNDAEKILSKKKPFFSNIMHSSGVVVKLVVQNFAGKKYTKCVGQLSSPRFAYEVCAFACISQQLKEITNSNARGPERKEKMSNLFRFVTIN